MGSARQDARFVPRKPAPSRVDVLLVGHTASNCEEFPRVDLSTQFLDLGNRACIILLDASTKGLPGCIQQHYSRHHAGNTYGGYLLSRNDGQQVPYRFDCRLPPAFGVLFSPSWMKRNQLMRVFHLRNDTTILLQSDFFEGCCADINAKYIPGCHTQASLSVR